MDIIFFALVRTHCGNSDEIVFIPSNLICKHFVVSGEVLHVSLPYTYPSKPTWKLCWRCRSLLHIQGPQVVLSGPDVPWKLHGLLAISSGIVRSRVSIQRC